ncbi:MAG: hypothetical protein AB1483_06195 [Candidatus Zixiibacteriota bacterium]
MVNSNFSKVVFATTLLVLVILTSTIVQSVNAGDMIRVIDTTQGGFTTSLDSLCGKDCTISRQVVEKMCYDCPPGYTAILLRSSSPPSVRVEHLTAFSSGQYLICSVELESPRVFALELVQQGVALVISGIRVFGTAYPEGERIGPQGSYQYASCSPDGTHCLLVDTGVTVVGLTNASVGILSIQPKIPADAANVNTPDLSNRVDGLGYNLSGKTLEMVWSTNITGKLVIRNAEGETAREIDIDVDMAE